MVGGGTLMGTTEVALERVFRQLIAGNVGLTIAELETYLAAWPNPQTAERLQAIKDGYKLMVDYWQLGVEDPQRDEQYQLLLQRLYVLSGNIAIFRHMNASSYLHGLYAGVRQQGSRWSLDTIRQEMESFVSDVAMLELDAEGVRQNKEQQLYQQHQQQLNRLFNFVVTSNIWSDRVAATMEQLLTSPTIDSNDQQLMVSAMMLSLMNRFDMAKFRTLVNVYQHSHDEAVRQRALVGWVLSIDDDFIAVYPEQCELIAQLLTSKKVCDELTELQMQLVYTLNADRDSTTMNQEIIPELMKNNNFKMTDHGLEEREEDPLEEVLHPEASEQRMERLEATFQRMQNMQQQGADIFFSGFSQMKRYPFFYDMSNWLMPFYMQHPDIQQFVSRMGEYSFVEKMIDNIPFCSSDKYSFVIAIQQVMSQLPENVREMVKRGEATLGGGEVSDEMLQSAAYIRRNYLMDLYRFFRLFPNRSALCNPFDTMKTEMGMCLFFGSRLFAGSPLEERKGEVVSMLFKQRLEKSANELLATFPKEMRDVQYYLWKKDYARVLDIDPDNERALVGMAREAFSKGAYEEANNYYEDLLSQHPEKKGYMLNRAVCLTHMEEYEEALKLLYERYYEEPENDAVNRALAWTLVCSQRLEEAAKLYQELIGREQATSEDFLNQGYCLWLQGKVVEAAESFRKSLELSGGNAENFWLSELQLLKKYQIGQTDIKMMEAEVKK